MESRGDILMQKWNTDLLELNAKLWEAAMNTTDNFSAEIRPKDAVDRQQEKTVDSFNACMGSSTQRVQQTLQYLENRGYVGKNMTVLDIGSGNGVYTIPFSRRYRQVTSLDISPAMQNEIRRRAAEGNIQNIDYLQYNWRDVDLQEAGMVEQYDLVFCSINPRGVCSLETLEKMNQASRKGCCLAAFAGRSKSNHGSEIQRIILGRNLGTTGGNNIIFPFNVVYHMGGEPDLNYATIAWERHQSPEDAVAGICESYWRFVDVTEEIREKVTDYVFSHLEDGEYVERVEHRIGIMVWDAWRTKENA